MQRGNGLPDQTPRRSAVLAFQIVSNLSELGESGLEVFEDLGGDDVGIRKVRAVFETFVFEQEPSRWEASETDGKAERLTEQGRRRNQHVEGSVESSASPAAALIMNRIKPRSPSWPRRPEFEQFRTAVKLLSCPPATTTRPFGSNVAVC